MSPEVHSPVMSPEAVDAQFAAMMANDGLAASIMNMQLNVTNFGEADMSAVADVVGQANLDTAYHSQEANADVAAWQVSAANAAASEAAIANAVNAIFENDDELVNA